MSGETKANVVSDFSSFHEQVSLINGTFKLPEASVALMKTIRAEIQKAAENITKSLEAASSEGKVRVDARFLQQGLLELQGAKDRLCCSVIIPYKKD